MNPRLLTLILALGCSWLLACSDSPTEAPPPHDKWIPNPPDTLVVYLGISTDEMPPGDTAIVTVTAEPPSGVALEEWSLRMEGMGGAVVPLPVTGGGAQTLELLVWVPRVPVRGEIVFTLTGIAEPDTATACDTLTIDDDRPPTFQELWGSPNVLPGDELQVNAIAQDKGGLAALTVDLSGAMQGHDSVGIAYQRGATASFRFLVPRTAALGDVIIATWHAIDLFGNQSEATQMIPLEDLSGPWAQLRLDSASALVDTARAVVAVAIGDTAYVTLTAVDNHALGYFGTVISGQRDSVPIAPDTLVTQTFTFTLPAFVPNTGLPRLSYFVRDSVGHLLERSSRLEFFNGIRHPLERLTDMGVNLGATLLHDPRRNRMYHFSSAVHFIAYDVPGTGIAFTLALPDQFADMDMTPSGDSVVITDINFGLYVVDLTEPTPRVQPMEIPDLPIFMPVSTVIDGSNRILVSGWPLLPEDGFHQQIDITTGTRTRLDLGFDSVATLVRSADRRLLLAVAGDTVVTYDLNAQRVLGLSRVHLATRYGAMDGTGSLIILRHPYYGVALYDDRLALINWLPMLDWDDTRFALSLDGETLFSAPGSARELHIRSMPDGQRLKRILTPEGTEAFVMLEDGRVLIAMNGMYEMMNGMYEIRNW
jgi:hypothetical protein